MARISFKVMTDEHIANAIAKQLIEKGVDAVRLIDVIDEGTPDPDVLEYCHVNGYTLITLDEQIKRQVEKRVSEGESHAGVLIGGHHLQGSPGIGTIVKYVTFMNEAINGGAATLENDVYNRISYIE
jgi:hypothetical protein